MKSKHVILIVALVVIAAIVFVVANKSAEAPISGGEDTIYYSGANAENLIKIESPKPGDTISSPLIITGKARGNWYFEATFPITLTNWDGLIIAEGYATAQGDWMTEDFVPFEATITFDMPQDIGDFSDYGSLIIHKSNASGLPEHDAAAEMRIRFR